MKVTDRDPLNGNPTNEMAASSSTEPAGEDWPISQHRSTTSALQKPATLSVTPRTEGEGLGTGHPHFIQH